jgi:hypothetical protein
MGKLKMSRTFDKWKCKFEIREGIIFKGEKMEDYIAINIIGKWYGNSAIFYNHKNDDNIPEFLKPQVIGFDNPEFFTKRIIEKITDYCYKIKKEYNI